MKFITIILLCLHGAMIPQTIFEPGDLWIMAAVSNNNDCSGNNAEDVLYLVSSKDIVSNTTFDITDNAWERRFIGYFGTTEGVYRLTRTGSAIPAGTIFRIGIRSFVGMDILSAENPGWSFERLSSNFPITYVNVNNSGDQLFLMQNGEWTEEATHKGSYSGLLIYGFNTKSTWVSADDTTSSNLPETLECYNTAVHAGGSVYMYYSGNENDTSMEDWRGRIQNPSNWSFTSACTTFQSQFSLNLIDFIDTLNSQPDELLEICEMENFHTLSLAVNGSNISYQWFENNSYQYAGASAIDGAISENVNLNNLSVGTYYFFCEISINGTCAFQTDIYKVEVFPLPITHIISPN